MSLLRVEGLSCRLPVGSSWVWALRGVDLEVRPGEMLALIGESGSGKSILGLAILGLLPPGALLAGRIWLDGADLLSEPPSRRRQRRGRDLAWVPQAAGRALHPHLTVEVQVAEGPAVVARRGWKAARAHARMLLDRVGLRPPDAVGRRYPGELSGGMRQRALVALGLASGARLVVADEPTKGVDETTRLEVVDLLRSALSPRGAVILITHDLEVAARADRVAVMYAGQVVEVGPAGAVLRAPRHPYTSALLAATPLGGLQPIPGDPPDPWEEGRGCLFRDRCPWAREACLEPPPRVDTVAGWVRCWRDALDRGRPLVSL